MPNFNALKEKLDAFQAKLLEKTDKIGFIKKWREKSAQAEANAAKYASPYSLNRIYREGSTGTRLQVLAFYLFIAVAIFSGASLLKKLSGKLRSSAANEQLKEEYSSGLAEVQRKALEKAEMISLGQFTASAYVGPPEETRMMRLDLWVKVSDPDAAAAINNTNDLFRDKTVDALNNLFASKVNMLQESGKATARAQIKDALNTGLKKGHVEDVFIENLIVQ